MNIKKIILLIVPFLLISNIALAKLVVVTTYHENAVGVRSGLCNYRVSEIDGSGNVVHLGNFVGTCPKYSKVQGNYTVDVSPTSEFGKVLLNSGVKKADLKNFVITDYDPKQISEQKPVKPSGK